MTEQEEKALEDFVTLVLPLEAMYGQKVREYTDELFRLQCHYPFPERPSTLASWLRAWLEMDAEFGPKTFQAALLQAMRQSEKFPHPVLIREACGDVLAAECSRKALGNLRAHDEEAQAHPEQFIEMATDPDWLAFYERHTPRTQRSTALTTHALTNNGKDTPAYE